MSITLPALAGAIILVTVVVVLVRARGTRGGDAGTIIASDGSCHPPSAHCDAADGGCDGGGGGD